jgi:hypothetical protein
MLCYHCQKVQECPIFRNLYTKSADFSINDCKDYVSAEKYKYRKIATNDDLMRLIYDYFTGQVKVKYSDEEIRQAITSTICGL